MAQKCIAIFLTDDSAQTYNGKPLMLQEVLFCPVLNWCMRAWTEKGVRRFFVVCEEQYHSEATACVPEGADFALGTPEDYEEALAAFVGDDWLDEVHEALLPVGSMMLSFHDLQELSRLRQAVKEDIANYHMSTRVLIMDPDNTYIDPRVSIGAGTVLLPGTMLRGNTVIGENCQIGPNAMITDSIIGDKTEVNASQVTDSVLGQAVHVGPFAHIRPQCQVGDRCKVGAFVEIKKCVLDHDTKLSHLTYVGDADVGHHVNFGCGTITSNYDGFKKYRTVIGDNVFVGCNTNLVPPVTVGDGAYIAAGTTVTKDVEPDSLVIGRVRQETKPGWAQKRRDMNGK